MTDQASTQIKPIAWLFNILRVGQRLWVKGEPDETGVFLAREISTKGQGEHVVIEGLIQNIDHQKNTISLLGRQFVLPEFCLQGLKAGLRIKLKGKYSENTGFAFKKIKSSDTQEANYQELKGNIDKIDAQSKTLELAGFMVQLDENTKLAKGISPAGYMEATQAVREALRASPHTKESQDENPAGAKFRILSLMHYEDHKARYNYQVNFGVIDEIKRKEDVLLRTFDLVVFERLPASTIDRLLSKDKINMIFAPLHNRWSDYASLQYLKKIGVPVILFDNDSNYYSWDEEFYSYFAHIFYRICDKHGGYPGNGTFHPWSVDTELFTPVFGGGRITMHCTISSSSYPDRIKIKEKYHPDLIDCSKLTGMEYIRSLQNSLAAITTGGGTYSVTRAKVLEYAATGTAIITIDTGNLETYFPRELYYIFEQPEQLPDLIDDLCRNKDEVIERQKELRKICEQKHSHKVRSQEIMKVLIQFI